jgi:predicted permease
VLDLKAALRALRRSPAFTLGTVLTLAVALGLVTTALGLLVGAISGGTKDPDRVVLYLTETSEGRQFRMRWPYPAVEVLRAGTRSFARLATYTQARLNADTGGETTRIDAEFVSPDYFDIVGITPALGRIPARPSRGGDAAPEVVISDGAWRRFFGASSAILGRELRVTRTPLTIVGVMPAGFRGLSARADAWLPHTLAPTLSFNGYLTSTEYFHTVIAELGPGITIEQARSEVSLLAPRIAEAVPPRAERAINRGVEVLSVDEARTSVATVRARTLATIGSVLVLLIAAVNIATLVAARVATRQREYAIRLAVGAGRARVFRTVAVELGLVMVAGFGAAMIVALWARDLVAAALPQALAAPGNDYGQLASFAAVRIDPVVIAIVAIVACVLTGFIALPACRRVVNDDLCELLKRAGAGLGRLPGVSMRALLAVQIAASIALLASAGLVFRSIWNLGQVDAGFDPRGVIALSVAEDLAVQRPASGSALAERLLETIGAVPGVTAVTVAQSTPFSARGARLAFEIEGRPVTPAPPIVGWHRVGPDHFAALRIPILKGRGFTPTDRRGRAPVVVINAAAAQRFFPDQDPIGQRIRLPEVIPGDAETAEIVGVVGNVVYWPVDEPPGPDVYQPALQFSHPFMTVMVRAAGDPAQVTALIRDAVRRADANLPLFDIVTVEDLAAMGRADRRFLLILLSLCAGLGLFLSAIGVFAMTASWLEARRRELGMRIALGAQPGGLVRLVMRGTMSQAATGVAGGIVLAFLAGQALEATLFGIAPHDPGTLAGAGIAMLAVSGIAAYLPARRALRLDPVREISAE